MILRKIIIYIYRSEKWHVTHRLPLIFSKSVLNSVWHNMIFISTIIFTNNIHLSYALSSSRVIFNENKGFAILRRLPVTPSSSVYKRAQSHGTMLLEKSTGNKMYPYIYKLHELALPSNANPEGLASSYALSYLKFLEISLWVEYKQSFRCQRKPAKKAPFSDKLL